MRKATYRPKVKPNLLNLLINFVGYEISFIININYNIKKFLIQ